MTENTITRKYPTRDECLKLLKDAGCSEKVIEHILIVTELALKIAKHFPEANLELLEAGALLHDIGRSKHIMWTMLWWVPKLYVS